jgi:CRP-like cAMP-binding protein
MATRQYPVIKPASLSRKPGVAKLGPAKRGTVTVMRTDERGKPIKNVILLSIPDAEFLALRPHLVPVDLPHEYVLHEPGGKIEHAYFLNEGMISLVVSTKGGRGCEIGIVGKEGMIASCIAVGLKRVPFQAITQIPGNGLKIRVEILERMLTQCPQLRELALRYVLLQGFQVAQIAACNRLHEMEQRLARWLLMCQDRVDSEVLLLTHEFLAEMLGSGRPTVSLASGVLQRAGLIENIRGTVRIINRKDLEEAACECYRVIQNYNGGLGLR